MANLLSELEMVDGDTSYLINLYDESAHDMMGVLSELETTDKTTLVGAINSEVTAITNEITARETAITNEATARETADRTLNGLIESETSARESAISSLRTEINNNIVYNPSNLSGTGNNIGLKEGTYNVTSNLTINAQLIVPNGAIINVASGVTLTINGQILAGRYQIFSGSGSISVNKAKQGYGYPEWFGAIPNNSSHDCQSAISKTLSTFGTCLLGKCSYYISTSIVMDSDDMKLIGTGYNDIFNDKDSTIIDTRGNGVTIKFGSQTTLSQINDYPKGITVEKLILDRSATVQTGSVGIETKQNLHGLISFVRSKNSQIAFKLNKNIYLKFYDNIAIQYFTSMEKFAIRCTDDVTSGVVGNNASIYIVNFSCTGSLDVAHYNAGLKIDDAPADTFIDGFETSGYQNGILIQDSNPTLNSSNDVHISRAVIDGYPLYGILLEGLSNSGSVTIENCYFAPNNTTNTYGVCVYNSSAGVTISDCQFILNVASSSAIGVYIRSSNSVICKGNIISDGARPYVIENGMAITIMDIIKSTTTKSSPVFDLSGTSEGIYICTGVNGIANAYPTLLRHTSNLPLEINVTPVNEACISGHLINDGTDDYDTVELHGYMLISGVKTI